MVPTDEIELTVGGANLTLAFTIAASILQLVKALTTPHGPNIGWEQAVGDPRSSDPPPLRFPAVGATLMDGKALGARIRAEVGREVAELDRLVGLATVLVGDDPASAIYVRRKEEACREAGIEAFHHGLSDETSEEDLLALLAELNADERVTGILVQLPLPSQIDEDRAIRALDPIKDVDGFHPINAGFLALGRPTLAPATPSGIVELLREYEIPLSGAEALVIGRSNIVGKPIALLLLAEHATVTVAHSRTRNVAALARQADVIVAAVGRPDTVTAEMVKPGATVIDVGINRVDGRVVGDVAEEVRQVAGHVTPVPGGVGPMTIAMLLQNTLRAARYQTRALAFPLVSG